MKGYKIYLTRSREVAGLIQKAYSKEDYVTKSSYGAADHYDQVPTIYHEGYFACVVEYDVDKPECRIEFA